VPDNRQKAKNCGEHPIWLPRRRLAAAAKKKASRWIDWRLG
jgi:hypothetical protein